MLMIDYLKQWREDMPEWLADYRTDDKVAFSDFMSGRVGFYPGAGYDGFLIETANQAHCLHSYLYVDYDCRRTREKVEYELIKKDSIRGYHSIGRVEWSHDDLMPQGDYHLPIELSTSRLNPDTFLEKKIQPFCMMEIYERDQDRDDSWGAERLAVTYLFDDGIATYFQLFVMKYKKAPWLFLLQDNGFGGNYDRFGKGGLLHLIIRKYEMYPKFVIVDKCPNGIWDGYHQIDHVEPDVRDIDNIHQRIRTLYQKDEE